MKKFLTISFLTVYVTLSIGLNIIVHTCGGESDVIVVTATVEDPCGCTDETQTERCCTTEITTVKLDDAQKAAGTSTVQKLVVVDVVYNETDFQNRFQVSGFKFETLIPHTPPPNKDLNISNSVFLI